jgi:N-acetylmuramoyl-L-alanine amidase
MYAPTTGAAAKCIERLLLAVAFAIVCASASVAAPVMSKAIQILAVRFGGDRSDTRMVVDTDQALSTRIEPGKSGSPRAVLTLMAKIRSEGENAVPLSGGGASLIRSWRIQRGPNGADLVLELEAGGKIAHRFSLPPASVGRPFRYVIDVQSGTGVAPSKTADSANGGSHPSARIQSVKQAQTTRPTTASQVAAATHRRGRDVIVIDAGHGGHDPGAQGADRNEKDITLATALALRKRLERDGRYKVVMTRDSDVFVPLDARVQIARHAGADLFISLHADSAGADPETHGASVYTLSDHGETRVTEVLGPREWFSRPGAHATDQAVGRILLDLTQRSTLNRSAVFAGLLIDNVSDKIDLLPRTHRDAGYFVLLAPDVPAVLLEMGFISSPRDQARLTDPMQRSHLVGGIAKAIDDYFSQQPDRAPSSRKARTVLETSVNPPSPGSSPTQPG